MAKNVIQQIAPNLAQQPRVDFKKDKFDALVWNKGAEVTWERAIKCPCKAEGGGPQSTCQNCQGIGYIMTDLIDTKMIIHSMNRNTKNKAWSLELIGTVSITALAENRLSFMDRVIMKNIDAIYTQTVYPIYSAQSKLFSFTVYNIEDLEYAALFQGPNLPLLQLDLTKITYNKNVIYFDDLGLTWRQGLAITLRYTHPVTYHVLDLQREAMQSFVKDKNNYGRDTNKELPVHAVGRRSAYIFGEENLAQNNYQYNNIGDDMPPPTG